MTTRLGPRPGSIARRLARIGALFAVALAAVGGIPGDGCRRAVHAADVPCEVFALDQPTIVKKGKDGVARERPFNDRYHTIVARTLEGKDLLRFSGIDDLRTQLDDFKTQHPACTCISALNLYAHGSESILRAGCTNTKGSPHKCTNAAQHRNYYFAGGGVPGDNRTSWSNLFGGLNPQGTAAFRMCNNGTIRLVGCNTGRCDHAGPFLAQIAKLAGVRTLAPAVYVAASKALAILDDPTVWQFGDPKAAAPEACKRPPRRKAPARQRRAALLPHCSCNGTTYDDVSSCTAECHASLACFTGICGPLWVNETWDPYDGNPVLTGSNAAVASAVTLAAPASAAPGPAFGSSDWYASGVSQPTVLREGGIYRMWFTGWNDADDGKIRIGYATSTDGIDWTVQPGPVLDAGPAGAFDEGEVSSPFVLRDGGVHHMWYVGFSDRDRIGHATSPDGITWTKDPSPVLDVGPEGAWDARLVCCPAVVRDGNGFMMWYKGRSKGLWDRIGVATSPDGIQWTRAASNPVLSEGDEGAWDDYGVDKPAVVRNAAGYHMFYAGMNATDWNEYDWGGYRRIGYAWSPDGVTWHKATTNPQLGPSPPFVDHDDIWDSQGVRNPAVLWDANENLFEVYVRGASLDESFAIGLFVADDLGEATATTTTTTAATTTTTTMPGTPCGSASECDDGDPCTVDACVAGSCSAMLAGGYAGVSCELDRLGALPGCDPDAGRKLVRGVLRKARSVQRKLARLEQTTRPRKRRALAKQVVGGLGGIERTLEKARRGGKLNDGCAGYFLGVVATARAGMEAVPAEPARTRRRSSGARGGAGSSGDENH